MYNAVILVGLVSPRVVSLLHARMNLGTRQHELCTVDVILVS